MAVAQIFFFTNYVFVRQAESRCRKTVFRAFQSWMNILTFWLKWDWTTSMIWKKEKIVLTLSVKLRKTWLYDRWYFCLIENKQKNLSSLKMTRCSVPSVWVPVRFSRLDLSAATSSTLNIHSRSYILDWNEDSNWMLFLISISFCQLPSHFILFSFILSFSLWGIA